MKMEFYSYVLLLGCSTFFCSCGVLGDDNIMVHIAKVGDRVVLPCYDSTRDQAITWFKGTEMISYGKSVYRYKSKFEIEKPVATETNLVIKTVEQSDEAIYSCKKVTDIIGNRQLIVETKPEIDEHASSPHSLEVYEGNTITIWCNVSGTPPPEVRWQRYLGRSDAPIEIGAVGNELTIHNITRYASDTYECNVTNRHGTVRRGITITVKFPVKATVYQGEITANIDQEVYMACMVEGKPIMDAYWKNVAGNRIDTNWKFEVREEDQAGLPLKLLTLKIRAQAFSEREYGIYICHAKDENTEFEARVHLMRPDPQNGKVINYQ